jgi:hypothetical protein
MSDLMAVFRRKAARTTLLNVKDSATLWDVLDKATNDAIR